MKKIPEHPVLNTIQALRRSFWLVVWILGVVTGTNIIAVFVNHLNNYQGRPTDLSPYGLVVILLGCVGLGSAFYISMWQSLLDVPYMLGMSYSLVEQNESTQIPIGIFSRNLLDDSFGAVATATGNHLEEQPYHNLAPGSGDLDRYLKAIAAVSGRAICLVVDVHYIDDLLIAIDYDCININHDSVLRKVKSPRRFTVENGIDLNWGETVENTAIAIMEDLQKNLNINPVLQVTGKSSF